MADVDVALVRGTERAGMPTIIPALGAAAAIIGLDQFTKELALSKLTLGSPVEVVWKLQWNLFFNTGSAFSLGSGLGPFIGVFAVIVSFGLLFGLRRDRGQLLHGLVVGAIVGGALGNVLDRLFRGRGTSDGFMRGAVVDFIDFQFWPVFNVADMAIVVGVILYVIRTMLHDRRDSRLVAEAEMDPVAQPSTDQAASVD